MKDNAGNIILYNDELAGAEMLDILQNEGEWRVYEVIRIIDGVPLFFEDHDSRMRNSIRLLGGEMADSEAVVRRRLEKLISALGGGNFNIKVLVFPKEGRQCFLAYCSKSYYPSGQEVAEGVPTALFRWERSQPNIKLENLGYKESVARFMKEKDVFEALLLTADGKITEGSKSNVFFIKGRTVYTAPGEYVLKGITRQYILDACANAGFQVAEELKDAGFLEEIDGLFISGTSIKVLPVSRVDKRTYNSSVNPVIVSIRDEYDRIIREYVENHKHI